MLTYLRAAMDAAQHDAEAASGNEWLSAPDGSGSAWVMNEDMHLLETEEPTAEHIARHDPAAVLRRIASDRKLLDEHAQYSLPDGSEIDECRVCGGSNEAWPCPTLRLIAEGYGWRADEPQG
ncbi:DUF6221 family protein [Streptomyces sp. H10-C2]|uniref:DUF6221 family protein n=1 Tax=unclassified Streptomyces TaxID=2593676 RepID=UPI0024BA07DC|nr:MULTISPECIES: DUF6221 family protein [unclassified Streptomyces]MDJ0345696.1 DUF6221 family protein [Streptomyces sp. PH10-H1]MDJ0374548.1 DUF6221 family protein [Streptomyces sp. H10-C2]